MNGPTHTVGSHSDDRGGESDWPCYCDQNVAPSNSKSEDTSLDWLERIAKFTDDYVDELNNEETDGDITGLHQIQDELISEIQAWHKAEVAKLLQVIEDEVIGEDSKVGDANTDSMIPKQFTQVSCENTLKAEQRQALKKLKDNVINGGSL